MPGGVNSPVRAFKSVQSEPLFITHAKGSRLFDADGNSFIDYIGSWGPMILGHADPRITSEIEKAVQKGTSFGTPTEGEIELAEMISDAVPSVEMVRLVNSGSEAAMGAHLELPEDSLVVTKSLNLRVVIMEVWMHF